MSTLHIQLDEMDRLDIQLDMKTALPGFRTFLSITALDLPMVPGTSPMDLPAHTVPQILLVPEQSMTHKLGQYEARPFNPLLTNHPHMDCVLQQFTWSA